MGYQINVLGRPFDKVGSGSSAPGNEFLIQEDATYRYYAAAPEGSLPSSAVWRAWRKKLSDGTIARADGDRLYDNVATSLSSLPYS